MVQHWKGEGQAATVDGEGTDMCCTMRRGESRHGSLRFFFSAQKDNWRWRRASAARQATWNGCVGGRRSCKVIRGRRRGGGTHVGGNEVVRG